MKTLNDKIDAAFSEQAELERRLTKLRTEIEGMRFLRDVGPVTISKCLPQHVDVSLDELSFTIKLYGHDPRRTDFARVLMNGGAVKLTVEVE